MSNRVNTLKEKAASIILSVIFLYNGILWAVAEPLTAPGGIAFTADRIDKEAYLSPGPGLSKKNHDLFLRGRVFFDVRWIVFPAINGEWGIGPTFLADSCSECHIKAGRGELPEKNDVLLQTALVQLSIPGDDSQGGPKPHPAYGTQIQTQGLVDYDSKAAGFIQVVPNEAEIYIDWQSHTVALADGEIIALRSPKLRIENLGYGSIGDDTMFSLRNTPAIFGLGLLEAVAAEAIIKQAQNQQAQGIVNGRPNYAWDIVKQDMALGRFGWKASIPNLRQQLATAFIRDIGITSTLFPKQNCSPVQTACASQARANEIEIIDSNLNNLEIWALGLAVPERRNPDDPQVMRGEQLFQQAQCALCHVPTLTTGPHPILPELANQTIHPYTDLLLHDMGEGLADNRPVYQAGPADWRTPALWGLGLSETVNGSHYLLHDGRARNVNEAILWHGGEAQGSRDAFANMAKTDRLALIKFIESL